MTTEIDPAYHEATREYSAEHAHSLSPPLSRPTKSCSRLGYRKITSIPRMASIIGARP